MTAGRTPPATGSQFPFVGLGLPILMLYAVVVIFLPPGPYRTAVATAALFATGYCALAVVVGRSFALSSSEVLAFTVGLTILIAALSGLAVSLLGIPITEYSILIVGLPTAFVAWYSRRSHGSSRRSILAPLRRQFEFPGYSRLEKGVIGALLAAIAVALVVFISLSGVFYPDRLSPGLALTGLDGTAASLPTSFVQGVAQGVVVSALGGSSGGTFEIRIGLIPTNATGNETFHAVSCGPPVQLDPFAECVLPITLGAGETWTQEILISIAATGSYRVQFELLDASFTTLAKNLLPVTVA